MVSAAGTGLLQASHRPHRSTCPPSAACRIAACGPLGIKTTLASAHLAIDESEAAAFAKLNEQFGALFHTEDFTEGRNAEAEGRPPVYHGK